MSDLVAPPIEMISSVTPLKGILKPPTGHKLSV